MNSQIEEIKESIQKHELGNKDELHDDYVKTIDFEPVKTSVETIQNQQKTINEILHILKNKTENSITQEQITEILKEYLTESIFNEKIENERSL